MYIPIILGTAREGRESEKVAKFVMTEAGKYGFETELIDVKDYASPATWSMKPDIKEKISAKIKNADALIIVAPEYNHSYPGELKIFMDNFYQEYFYKPIGICGVSSGFLGGARMVEQLRLVSIEFHMIPIREALFFSSVKTIFNENGSVKDQGYLEKLKTMFKELEMITNRLK